MTDFNYSERKNRELKERSSSAKSIKTGRDYRNFDYFGSSSKADPPQLVSKQSKEYSNV